MKTIGSKILAVVISGLIVMTAVVSLIGFINTHELMHRDADRILGNRCKMEAAYINDTLGDIQKSVKIMEHYARKELESVNSLKDYNYRVEYLKNVGEMFNEVALNTDGVEAFFLRLNPEYSSYTAGFSVGYDKSGLVFAELPTTDLSAYSPEDTEAVGWYYEPIKAKAGIWMQPYYNHRTEKMIISYITPYYVDGVLAGVLGMDIDFSYMLKTIEGISVYENGYAILVGSDGKEIYSGISDEGNAHSHDKHTAAIGKLENGMSLELVADYKDIQREVRPILFKIIGSFILVLLAFCIYAFIVTKKITAPIKKLTAIINEDITDKDIKDLPVDSKDEIGVLSQAFVSAYDRIQEYTSYINALAYRDTLTGIKNRAAYNEAVEEITKEINVGLPNFALLVADINFLKETNDKYGHDIGNKLIIHAARNICAAFKSSPVFRIGGDEFVVILKGEDLLNYSEFLENMDAEFAKDYIKVKDGKIPVSVARGVAVYNPLVDKVFDDVFRNADQLMYMHKEKMKKI